MLHIPFIKTRIRLAQMFFLYGLTACRLSERLILNPACLWDIGVFFYRNKPFLFITVLIVQLHNTLYSHIVFVIAHRNNTTLFTFT